MRCYYRHGISCGANRKESEEQSVIKGKIKIKWDKTKLVSHLGDWEGFYVKRGEEKKKRKKKKKISSMDYYVFVWIAMVLYGFVNICMNLYGMDSWIIDLVPCLGFCYEKF